MTKTTLSKYDIEIELIAITRQLLEESGSRYRREIKSDASLQRHLGIDSLGRAELFQRIEKAFEVNVPDRLLAEAETLSDIAAFLETSETGVKREKQERHIITPHDDVSTLDPSQTESLLDIIWLYGQFSPNKPHIYFQHEDGTDEVITYGELLDRSLRVAASLRERGLKDGETVAIMQPTNPGFFYTFLGTLLAGGVPVPIYPPFRMHALEAYAKTEAHILKSAEVRILVTFSEAENLSRILKTFVPSLKHVTTVDDLLGKEKLATPFKAKGDNFAMIQYTSGSTSMPKGVLLTHYNLLSNIRAYGKAINVSPQDVTVSWLPLYHDMGLIGMWLGSLYFAAPLILMTPFSFLNHPEKWLWAIHDHRGTLSGAPNFAYELCVKKVGHELIEGLDLSSWRMAANGAEKVYPRTLELFAKKFAPYGFKPEAITPMYGLAESSVGLAIPPMNRGFIIDRVDRQKFEEDRLAEPASGENDLQFVSCGVPIEGHEIRITDEEHKPLPERHIGNLQFRGPSSMQGYYNNPRATQAIYHDGWLDTGDLAYMADGEVYITGRRKDLIIKAGRNLYPVEIEELVGSVPGVRLGCVAAFESSDEERATEELVIVAETREQNLHEKDEITQKIKEVIATALDIVPDHVIMVAPHVVPKTSSGKLQRSACKKMYEEGKLGKSSSPAWMQIARLTLKGVSRQLLTGLGYVARFFYTAYVIALFALSLLPIYLIVHLVSNKTASRICRIHSRLLLLLCFCPIRVVGAKKLNKYSPVIYTPNHASYIDAIVAMAVMPANTRIIAKKEVFSIPIVSTIMRKLNYLELDRSALPKGIEDTARMRETLDNGDSLLIFPEGTFGYASGLRPFRLGAFKIAAETQTPICPVAFKGTRKVLRDDEKLMRPGFITVTVCEPIRAAGNEWQDVTNLRTEARLEIAKHCGEPSLDFIAAQTVAPSRKDVE